MDDPASVGMLERATGFVRQSQALVDSQAPVLGSRQQQLQRPALHVLDDDEGLSVTLANVVDSDDVGVVTELTHRPRFPPQATKSTLVQTLGLDERNGDVAFE